MTGAGVPRRPLLAPWYRLVGDGDRLLLEHGQVVVVLEGGAVRTLLPVLLPLLDGTRTVDDLVARVGEAARPAVDLALATLADHGLLVEGPDAEPGARAAAHALAAAHGLAPADAADRLASASVAVVGAAPAGADVARLLHVAGVGEVPRRSWRRAPDADVTVVAPASDELDGLPAWNRLALRHGVRWLALRPWDGRFAGVGPVVVPGETACWECVVLRRAANLQYGADLGDLDAAPSAAAADPGLDALVAALAAHVLLRWSVGGDTTVAGVLYAVETQPRPAVTEHRVLRVPRCPACSGVERGAPPLPWHEAEAA